MKLIAYIEESTLQNGLGLKSRFDLKIAETPLLTHIVNELKHSGFFSQVVVACPPEASSTLKNILPDDVDLFSHDIKDCPQRQRLRRGRKWGRYGWRGGLANTFVFCEEGNMRVAKALCDQYEVDGIMFIPASAPFVAYDIMAALITRFSKMKQVANIAFANSPPGLNYVLASTKALSMFTEKHLTLGAMIKYKPDSPEVDIVRMPFCETVSLSISSSPYRYILDSDSGTKFCQELLKHLSPDQRRNALAVTSMAESLTHKNIWQSITPREIEIEITGVSTIKDSLYPEGQTSRSQTAMSLSTFKKTIDDLPREDDLCITLGGYGDPLLHDDILTMIDYCHHLGIWGIHIATNGNQLTPALSKTLNESSLDVLSIRLDAHSEKTYNKLKKSGDFKKVGKNIETFIEHQHLNGPLLSIEFCKVAENFSEMRDFYDYWYGRLDHCVIRNLAENSSLDSLRSRSGDAAQVVYRYRQQSVDVDGCVSFR